MQTLNGPGGGRASPDDGLSHHASHTQDRDRHTPLRSLRRLPNDAGKAGQLGSGTEREDEQVTRSAIIVVSLFIHTIAIIRTTSSLA